MSEILFRQKIAVPKYVPGNLAQAYAQGTQLGLQEANMQANQLLTKRRLDLQEDALKQKAAAAKAEKLQKQLAERAKIVGQLGGLYSDVHPYAGKFIEEAYGKLQEDLMPLMYMPEGAEMAKMYIANFKQSAEKYAMDEDMRKQHADMVAMLNPQSAEYLAKSKEMGPLYRPEVTEQSIQAAEDYEYHNLMDGAELEYNMGKFTIKGVAYDPLNGLGNEVIALENHPRFNDKNVFEPSSVGVAGVSIPELGQAIKTAERVGDATWNWEEISANYAQHYSGAMPFQDLDRNSNEAYQYRFQVFTEGREELREAAAGLAPNQDEVLLDMYSLDPKYKSSNPVVYNLIKEHLKSYWETDLKPHTKWVTDPDEDDGSVAFLASAAPTALSEAELPKQLYSDPNNPAIQEGQLYPFMAIPAEVAEGQREMKTAAYATQSLPNKQMENIEIPLVNTKYYQQMKIYEAAGLIQYDPFGRPRPNEEVENVDPVMMEGVINLLQKSDLIKAQKLNSLIAYEGNPNVVGLATGDGTIEVINLSDLGSRESVIMANINAGLDKMGYAWKDIYNDALNNHFNGTRQTVVFD